MIQRNRDRKIGVAIIGAGEMATKHAQAWQSRKEARIIAVSSPTPHRRETLAHKTGAVPYADAGEAINAANVDAISLCIPAGLHADYAVLALQRGRHVLCEKPLALTLEDADRMIASAQKHGRLLATSFQYRGVPRVQHYRQMIAKGQFGEPLLWQYRDIRQVRPKLAMHQPTGNGGVVVDMAGHHIDAMRYLTGCEPKRVTAAGGIFGRGKPTLAQLEELAVDTAMIQVEYEGGHILQSFLNWGMPEGFPEQRTEFLSGPLASARVGEAEFEKRFELIRSGEIESFPDSEPDPACRVHDFLDAILGRRELEVSDKDGRIALSVSLAAKKSLQQGGSVELVAPAW